MRYTYNGTLKCDTNCENTFLNVFEKYDLIPHGDKSIERNDGYTEVFFDEESGMGSIRDDLNSAIKELHKLNIDVNGSISYYGDEEGRFDVEDSVLDELDRDAMAIRDMSDKQLKEEAERRGYRLSKGKIYILYECDEHKMRDSMMILAVSTSADAIADLIRKVIEDGGSMNYGGLETPKKQIHKLKKDYEEFGADNIGMLNERLGCGLIEIYDDFRKIDEPEPCGKCFASKIMDMYGRVVRGCDMSNCIKADAED